MKFSLGNIYFSNNVSNSYITMLYFKNDYKMTYICKKIIFISEMLTFHSTSYFKTGE